MKIKLDGDNILHGDFMHPMPIARFTNNVLTDIAKQQFVSRHNSGMDMLEIFERNAHANDFESVMMMFKELQQTFALYCELGIYAKRLARSETRKEMRKTTINPEPE